MARDFYSKWIWKDWLADEALHRCSLAARGLWIDMLAYMAGSCRRGYLLTRSGKTITPEALAEMVKVDAGEVSRLLQELERAEVFSRDRSAIYNRRMVRDEEVREVSRVYGLQGGNPALIPPDKGGDNPTVTITSNSDSSGKTEVAEKTARVRARDPIFEVIVELWYSDGVMTDRQRDLANTIAKEFRQLKTTPEEIRARLARYKKTWPNAAATGTALAKNWHQFAGGNGHSPKATRAKLDRELADAEKSERHVAASRIRAQIAAIEANAGAAT